GLITARGSANLLTRTTVILGALFFATAIGLTIVNDLDRGSSGILDRAVTTPEGQETPASVLDALNALQGDSTSDLPVPVETTPAAPAADATTGTAPAAEATPAEPATPDNADLLVPEAPAETPAAPTSN
ncbi:MAG: preprotein translocase subunit SecG, partial [Candidatus Devosia euplotis]|nr:preprotein translocase subunit SecG [Candidatus Devosia euplotis]